MKQIGGIHVVKKCLYCGKYFSPDRRVGVRQKACHREECRKARKKAAQKNWFKKNPEYFKGDYWRIKEWRLEKKRSSPAQPVKQDMIQDKIPPSKPYQQLVLLIPEGKAGMIQDEIRLRRVDRYTFVAYG
jgi:hypothetical protein